MIVRLNNEELGPLKTEIEYDDNDVFLDRSTSHNLRNLWKRRESLRVIGWKHENQVRNGLFLFKDEEGIHQNECVFGHEKDIISRYINTPE